jgi:hypothetical protein
MGKQGRRVRALLDGQFWVAVALLGALVLGGGYLTYDTYADPGFQVEQRPGEGATYVRSISHRATVQQPNPVFDQGETLVDRSAYFTRLTPRVNGTFSFTYSASQDGDLATDVRLELRLRSVGEGGEGQGTFEYWSVTRQLDAVERESLAPDEELEVTFSRNVSALFNESARIDERVGGTPGTKLVRIVAIVEADGEVNGRDVAWTREYPVEFVDEDSIYRVETPGRVTNATNTTRTVRVQNTFGPLREGGAPLLALLGVVGLGALGFARYRGALALTDAERAYRTYERSRSEFDDWITTARIDPETFDGERIDVGTLDGLVDVAIDSDRRVLEDAATGACYCRIDGLVYRYDPPPEPPEGPLARVGQRGGPAENSGRPDEWADGDPADEGRPADPLGPEASESDASADGTEASAEGTTERRDDS